MLQVKDLEILKKILRYVRLFLGAVGCVDVQIETEE